MRRCQAGKSLETMLERLEKLVLDKRESGKGLLLTLGGGTWARAGYEPGLLPCSVATTVLLWTGLGPRVLERKS